MAPWYLFAAHLVLSAAISDAEQAQCVDGDVCEASTAVHDDIALLQSVVHMNQQPAGELQCPPGAHDDGPGMGCVCDSNHDPTTDGSNCGSGGNGPVSTMTCLGNPQTWDAGYGLCDTYGPGSGNYGYCSSDCTDGLCADKVCALCGLCG